MTQGKRTGRTGIRQVSKVQQGQSTSSFKGTIEETIESWELYNLDLTLSKWHMDLFQTQNSCQVSTRALLACLFLYAREAAPLGTGTYILISESQDSSCSASCSPQLENEGATSWPTCPGSMAFSWTHSIPEKIPKGSGEQTTWGPVPHLCTRNKPIVQQHHPAASGLVSC